MKVAACAQPVYSRSITLKTLPPWETNFYGARSVRELMAREWVEGHIAMGDKDNCPGFLSPNLQIHTLSMPRPLRRHRPHCFLSLENVPACRPSIQSAQKVKRAGPASLLGPILWIWQPLQAGKCCSQSHQVAEPDSRRKSHTEA